MLITKTTGEESVSWSLCLSIMRHNLLSRVSAIKCFSESLQHKRVRHLAGISRIVPSHSRHTLICAPSVVIHSFASKAHCCLAETIERVKARVVWKSNRFESLKTETRFRKNKRRDYVLRQNTNILCMHTLFYLYYYTTDISLSLVILFVI